MRLALYQPDIPQNLGAMLRLAACFGVGVDVIEPCGFPLDDKKIRRAGMDYLTHTVMTRHDSWEAFLHSIRGQESRTITGGQQTDPALSGVPLREQKASAGNNRIILLTTKAELCYTRLNFEQDDLLLVGRESAGVPEEVARSVDARVIIPMRPPARSLNVATAAAIVLAEALRQTGQLPDAAARSPG